MKNYIVDEILHFCNVSLNQCYKIPQTKINYYDLTFMLTGNMTYMADDQTYTLEKNDAILLPPDTFRSRLADNKAVSYVSFNFTILPNTKLPFTGFIKNCISPEIIKLVSAFPQQHLSPHFHSKEKASNILNYILFEISDVLSLKSNNTHVLNIVKYIDENITKTITLQSISNHFGLTKEYIAYLFKKETNKTVTDYINERKIILAKELILKNEMKISEISAYLGYQNYNYFSRIFKRYLEISPKQFKNKY